MEKRKHLNMAALINIEPDLVKMRISKLNNDGNLIDIEKLECQTKLGHELFNNQKISFEILREISSILNGYKCILNDYNIKKFKIVASALLNDTENCAYIIDQLRIRNGMSVKIFEDRQEKSLAYFEILNVLKKSKYKNVGKSLISYIGAGNISFCIYDKQKILFYQSVDMGSSKLYEILEPVQEYSTDFSLAVEEYIDIMIDRLKFPINNSQIENLIVSGSEVNLIARLCQAKETENIYEISLKSVSELYDKIKKLSAQAISEKYDISIKGAQILFTSLAIYCKIFKITKAKKILSPKIEPWDAVIKQTLSCKIKKQFEEHLALSAVFCAQILSYHFYFNQDHIDSIYLYATLIFDRLKKLHGLDKRKKLFLDLAIILHEAGYYVNSKDPRISTFDIIKNLDLYGLSEREAVMVANIIRYSEFTVPNRNDAEYARLSDAEKLLVSKMVAIFRLSNALDKSKKQKLKNMKIKISNENLIINAESKENASLETWAVNKCSEFFKEVFGLKVKLNVKSDLL